MTPRSSRRTSAGCARTLSRNRTARRDTFPHATAMLAAALPVARGLGIERALLTCDKDNIGSRKVIEANGGVLDGEPGGILRYWVPTA